MGSLISWLEGIFKKAPALPVKGKEWLVKAAPYIAIISAVFGGLAVLGLLGLGMYSFGLLSAFYGPGAAGYFGGFSVAMLFLIASVVLEIIAIPGLFKRAPSGWNFAFYGVALDGVYSLINGNIFDAILTLAIGFYILFQIRPYYFGGAAISAGPATPTPTSPPQQPPTA